MKRHFNALFLILALVFGLSLTSCEGFDWDNAIQQGGNILGGIAESGNCSEYDKELHDALQLEGQLYDEIPRDGAFSMALVLNQEMVNRMFRAAAEWNYEFDLAGLASLKVQLPEIQVGGPECVEDCLIFRIPVEGSVAGTKIGFEGKFAFPIEDEVIQCDRVDEVTGESYTTLCTEMMADLMKAQILNLSVTFGKTYAMIGMIQDLLETALKTYLSSQLGKVRLFEVQAWEVGEHKVKLLAGAPKIDAGNHTLTFGMYTNMIMSLEESVRWSESFPEDAEVGLHIHPELIRALIGRMLHEGEVPRSVDLSGGESSESGTGFDITLQSMNSDLWASPEYFNMGFRLWQTKASNADGSGVCGWMDVMSGLKIEISDEHFTFGLGDIKVVDAKGSGKIAGALINAITNTEFFHRLLDFAEITVNFNEIGVGSKTKGNTQKIDMQAKTFQFNADGNGLSLYLNVADF